MPLSVQVAAPASQSAQMLAGSSSSTPSSSTGNGGSGERAFSNHLEAEKRIDSGRAGEAKEKSAAKRSETAEAGTNDDDNESSEDTEVLASSGNASPLEDVLLPQQAVALTTVEPETETLLPIDVENVGVELLPAQSEALSASAQQVAVQVDSASVAAALRQGGVPGSNDMGALNSASPGSKEIADTLTRPGPASVVSTELARVLSGKQSLASSGDFVDAEVDVELDVDSGMELLSGKIVKPLLEGSVANSTVKMPEAQVVAEALSNGSGSKESFEQVRQNIVAAMAGKSELAGPMLNTGADGGESAPQSLNFSNVSSTLSVSGAESAKYSATQETAPPRFFTLQTPAGQPGWDVEVGNRIRWMVGQNNSGLELRLNPAELGSVEVKLSSEGERTNITFFAANSAAREALEAALPRLREMFADSGMQLANADVSDQSLQQEREQLADSGALASDSNSGETVILETEPGLIPGGQAESRGVIDYYI